MLKNTLIVPETDARLAAKLIQDAIDTLDIILLFVFGKDEPATQAVQWADRLCNKTQVSETFNLRKVVWIRDPAPASVHAVIDPIFGESPLPQVAVLNFHDRLMGTIPKGGKIDPLQLEKLFLKGGTT
jgi:hypothetical protein